MNVVDPPDDTSPYDTTREIIFADTTKRDEHCTCVSTVENSMARMKGLRTVESRALRSQLSVVLLSV